MHCLLGLIRDLPHLETLDGGGLVNLEVVLVLFVVLEDQVHVVIVVGHVGEHLEDLLEGRCEAEYSLMQNSSFLSSMRPNRKPIDLLWRSTRNLNELLW